MKCECGSPRIMEIYAKHNDLATMTVRHLHVRVDGYLPYIGIFGGSELNLKVCMECGRIQKFKQITDDEIQKSAEVKETIRLQNKKKKLNEKLEATMNPEPATFSLKDVARQKVVVLLINEFGLDWRRNAEAKAILQDALRVAEGPAKAEAIRELLESMEVKDDRA